MPNHYANPDYPVLSFLYALYTDPGVSQDAIAKHQAGDDSYLDPYRSNPNRPFPKGARDLIHVEVPKGPAQANGVRLPTRMMCSKMMPYLVAELAALQAEPGDGKQTVASAAARQPAVMQNNSVPLLSCLAVAFLNQDPAFRNATAAFLKPFTLDDDVRELLTEIAVPATPTPHQVYGLSSALADEWSVWICW